MTVISSLFSGISGIVSNGSALSVVGDNIANMSTSAFKSSAPVFETAISQKIGEAEIGLGSRLAGTSANFTQGAFASTTRDTDLAIDGKGFFIVNDAAGNTFYTRAGAFSRNSEGKLVTVGGFKLQGRFVSAVDSNGTAASVDASTGDISLQAISSSANQTSKIVFSVNLDANDTVPSAFDGSSFTQAEATSNFNVPNVIYDSLGNPHDAITYFRKSATANVWQYRTLVEGSDLSTGASSGTVVIDSGQITFNSSGSFTNVTRDTPTTTSALTLISAGTFVSYINWAGGAAAQTSVSHDFGQVTGSTAIMTQYSDSESSVKAVTQDGYAAGSLQSIEIEEDGTLRGNFSNGRTRDLYKIPLASFANEQGLIRRGANLYQASASSGSAQPGLAQSGGLGKVQAFTLEQSNVDLASEFVKIITFQRAFQASSRTVSTAAELLQDLVQLGR